MGLQFRRTGRPEFFLVFHQLEGERQLQGGLVILQVQASELLKLGDSIFDGVHMDR